MPTMTRGVMRWMALLALALGGCTPALNWRQVHVDGSDVMVWLPCKPDQALRPITLRRGDQDVSANLSLQGCEASDMQFTFGHMAAPDGLTPDEVTHAWQLASLASLHASMQEALAEDAQMKNANGRTSRVRIATGAHQVQWMWFVHGNIIYQAAVYGKTKEKGLPEAAETYFSGIKLP